MGGSPLATQGRNWGSLGALVALMQLLSGVALAAAFTVGAVTTRLEGNLYVADARIEYRFSPVALEALDNGVPLTVDVHLQVRRRSAWLWEDSLVDRHLRYSIRYQPLSERYLVAQLPDGFKKSFVSREAAIVALGELEGITLLGQDRLKPNERYEVQLNASLDLEALPLPLRPMAYLRPSWKLSSGWSEWKLRP
jgi:hypothetical protein